MSVVLTSWQYRLSLKLEPEVRVPSQPQHPDAPGLLVSHERCFESDVLVLVHFRCTRCGAFYASYARPQADGIYLRSRHVFRSSEPPCIRGLNAPELLQCTSRPRTVEHRCATMVRPTSVLSFATLALWRPSSFYCHCTRATRAYVAVRTHCGADAVASDSLAEPSYG